MYLTTNFFEKRKLGWSEMSHKIKSGATVGYCFNGTAYSVKDTEEVRKIVYETVYKSLIKHKQSFNKLVEILDSAQIELSGAGNDVLQVLAEALVESPVKTK